MSAEELDFSLVDGLARLVLTRPRKRNALTADMWSAIIEALGSPAPEIDVRVLVITGSGGAFCAGADLASVRDASGRESTGYRELAEAGLAAVRDFSRPTVAVIDGPCIGAGLLLALACDVRFASVRATFALPAVRYGLAVADIAIGRLVELAGSGTASRILVAGETVNGERAAAVGLVEHCGPDFAEEADAYVDAIRSAPADAVAEARAGIRRSGRAERAVPVAGSSETYANSDGETT